jgi:hypothetical protein
MGDWTPLFKSDFRFSQPFNIFEFVRDAVIRRNESIDFFLAADRGMGKSASAMSLAMMLDPNFRVEHWCFTQDRFIELITSHQPKGTVIVFDDVGTAEGSSSRKWQKDEAHDLADIMQVNRTDGIITVGTSLQLGRMELRLRAGFRVLCQPIRKLTAQETGNGMAIDTEMRLRTVDVFDDTVRYKLWRYAPGGRVKYVRLFHPPAVIWNRYQVIRKEFLDGVKARREEKEAAAAERKEKKEVNSIEKAKTATDGQWAKVLHCQKSNFKVYKNLFKRIEPMTNIEKSVFVTMVADASAVSEKTAVRKILDWCTDGLVRKGRTFKPDGRPDSHTYEITDRGRDLVHNRPILED